MDWFDLRAVQGTFKSLLQYHSSKASICNWHKSVYEQSIRSSLLQEGSTAYAKALRQGFLWRWRDSVMQKYLETEWRRGRTLIKTLLEGGCRRNRVIETTGKIWPLTQSEMGRYWRIRLKANNSGCWFMNILQRQRQMEVTYWKAFAIGHGRADSKWAPGVCSRGAVFWREIQILLMDWMQTVSEREKWKVNPRFSWPEQPRGWVCLQLWCGRSGEWE